MTPTETHYVQNNEIINPGEDITVRGLVPVWAISGTKGGVVSNLRLFGDLDTMAFRLTRNGEVNIRKIAVPNRIGTFFKSEAEGGSATLENINIESTVGYALFAGGSGTITAKGFTVKIGSFDETPVRITRNVTFIGHTLCLRDLINNKSNKGSVARFHNKSTLLNWFGTADFPCEGLVHVGPETYDEMLMADSCDLFLVSDGYLKGGITFSPGLKRAVLNRMKIDASQFSFNGNVPISIQNEGYKDRPYPPIEATDCDFIGREKTAAGKPFVNYVKRINCTVNGKLTPDINLVDPVVITPIPNPDSVEIDAPLELKKMRVKGGWTIQFVPGAGVDTIEVYCELTGKGVKPITKTIREPFILQDTFINYEWEKPFTVVALMYGNGKRMGSKTLQWRLDGKPIKDVKNG